MNRKIEQRNASPSRFKNVNEKGSPIKQNLHGFENFNINDDFNKLKSPRENDFDTNRTTDSLDVFPTT